MPFPPPSPEKWATSTNRSSQWSALWLTSTSLSLVDWFVIRNAGVTSLLVPYLGCSSTRRWSLSFDQTKISVSVSAIRLEGSRSVFSSYRSTFTHASSDGRTRTGQESCSFSVWYSTRTEVQNTLGPNVECRQSDRYATYLQRSSAEVQIWKSLRWCDQIEQQVPCVYVGWIKDIV